MTTFIETASAAWQEQRLSKKRAETDSDFKDYLDFVKARNLTAQVLRNTSNKLTVEFDRTLKEIECGEVLSSNLVIDLFSDSEFFKEDLRSLIEYFDLGFPATKLGLPVTSPSCGFCFKLRDAFRAEFAAKVENGDLGLTSDGELIEWLLFFTLGISIISIFHSKNYDPDMDVFQIDSYFAVNRTIEKPFIEKATKAFFEANNSLVTELKKLIEILDQAGIDSNRLSVFSSGKLVVYLG